MRVEFINKVGGKMFVDESRVEEYKAAGYVLAANVVSDEGKQTEPVEKEVKTTARTASKTTTKKTTKK